MIVAGSFHDMSVMSIMICLFGRMDGLLNNENNFQIKKESDMDGQRRWHTLYKINKNGKQVDQFDAVESLT